jgi:hypothetical protein
MKKSLKVRGKFAVNGDAFSRAWMNELKMRCVESDTGDSPLRRFRWIVLSVADDRMADR